MVKWGTSRRSLPSRFRSMSFNRESSGDRWTVIVSGYFNPPRARSSAGFREFLWSSLMSRKNRARLDNPPRANNPTRTTPAAPSRRAGRMGGNHRAARPTPPKPVKKRRPVAENEKSPRSKGRRAAVSDKKEPPAKSMTQDPKTAAQAMTEAVDADSVTAAAKSDSPVTAQA
jgi:hypothetical protein